VVIPTLASDPVLWDCLRSLDRQTWRDFEVVVVDNSGSGRLRSLSRVYGHVRVLAPDRNLGFGGGINLGWRSSSSPYIAVLNDDATASPDWLEQLLRAAESQPYAGMCASRVLLAENGLMDSAGMLIALDGSSKQRGHLEEADMFEEDDTVLGPSGSAALYRRDLLEEAGGFDDKFFLYCEDTDLALRARWLGWQCVYAAQAVVEHQYSKSAGRASRLKAYYVERNRLFLIIKNFPFQELALAPFAALIRYYWHVLALRRGHGKAGEFRAAGNSRALLVWYVLKAHLAVLWNIPRLWKQRRAIRRNARISPAKFRALLRRHSISIEEVAAQ
jgi:GT2 family glycosyltransferase